MKRLLILAGTLAALTAGASSAAAQAARTPAWFGSIEVGAQAVENIGGLGGLQVGRHVSPRLDVFGEAVYLQDIVTRRRSESISGLASYLTQTQGRAASGSIDLPTWAFGAGVKYFLTGKRSLRPYVVGQAGMARVVLRPAFELGGADVTSTLGQYGVTLGSDLTGTTTKPMFGGGLGVVMQRGAWHIDAGLRIFSVQLDGQTANASTLAIGFGRGF